MEQLKKQKKRAIIIFVVLQTILLVFWGLIIVERAFPIYKWETGAYLGQSLSTSTPVRFETFLTPSAERFNNQKAESAMGRVSEAFIYDNNLTINPEYKIILNQKSKLVYEIFNEDESCKWRVSIFFGNENAFDISVSDIGGGMK